MLTLNCACQIPVTQPRHSIFISLLTKDAEQWLKTFDPLERVWQPSARFQLPPPLPLTLLRSSYILLPHTWALVVLEYVRGSCSVDVTCRAVLGRVLRSPYCQVIIYCSNIPMQQGLRQSEELAQSGCDSPPCNLNDGDVADQVGCSIVRLSCSNSQAHCMIDACAESRQESEGRQQSESVRDSTDTRPCLFDLLLPSYVLVSPIWAISGLDSFPRASKSRGTSSNDRS